MIKIVRHPSGRPIRRRHEVGRPFLRIPEDGPLTPRLRGESLVDQIGFVRSEDYPTEDGEGEESRRRR